MKLIIEIDEKEYNGIKEDNSGMFGGHIYQSIRDGIPLPEEKINEERWLPIPGKWLPEESGTYLVTMRANFFDEIMYITTYAHYFARENRWVVGDDAFEEDKIVAWMPFPEAYKESEEC
ncbi:hypothetical protein [Segatella bryantii]|nr:hypothetical protein [Segatella bryantii]